MITFSGRLRLALILAALFPTALITLIVVAGLPQEVKRVEHRDASVACERFTDILNQSIYQIRQNLRFITESREFQLVEWDVIAHKRPDPKYRLPLLSLDFVEYLDSDGMILLSANRPALMGQRLGSDSTGALPDSQPRLVYENDLHGSHPAMALAMATENGRLRGGIFLDGTFKEVASAATRSTLNYVDIRGLNISKATLPGPVGKPYRTSDTLFAIPVFDSTGEFYPVARFAPYERSALFSNFFTAVLAVTVISLAMVIPAGLYFSSRTRRELDTLAGGAARVAQGDFTRPVTPSDWGEFSDLADAFNTMMKQLTEYRDRLIVSQKIAAWQTMGRRIAHEVKNPLTPITVAIDDLRHSFEEHRPDYEQILRENLDTMKREVNRIKKLVDEFSAFARMPAPHIMAVGSDTLAHDIAALYRDDITEGRLMVTNDLGAGSIRIDPDQFREVIINLIKNSREAGSSSCLVHMKRENERLVVIVEDDGPGFPEKLLKEGITPYFSTKKDGSGLGLVISQRIIFDHDGTLALENKPDGGARVIICLPQSHA
jgi:signal transduction histidine kinase